MTYFIYFQENILPNSTFNGIYANTRALNGVHPTGNSTINRTSLMSTGSSEEGTSSGSASSGESSHISSYNDQGIEVSSCTNSTTGEFNDIMQDLCFQYKLQKGCDEFL